MIQTFGLKNFPSIISLHDCETCAVEYLANKLIFIFDKEKVSDALKTNSTDLLPYNKLKVSYILSKDFDDDKYCPIVKHVNHNTFFRKNAIQLWMLKKLVEHLNQKRLNLMFYDHYFNGRNCIIFAELVKGYDWQMGNWFEIELIVDEIIYEWIE